MGQKVVLVLDWKTGKRFVDVHSVLGLWRSVAHSREPIRVIKTANRAREHTKAAGRNTIEE